MTGKKCKIILSDLLDRVEQLENSVLLLKNNSIGVNFVHYPVNSQLNLTDNNQIILANILPFQSNINTQFDVLILYDSISNVDVFCNLKIGDYESSNLIKQSTKNITNILLRSHPNRERRDAKRRHKPTPILITNISKILGFSRMKGNLYQFQGEIPKIIAHFGICKVG